MFLVGDENVKRRERHAKNIFNLKEAAASTTEVRDKLQKCKRQTDMEMRSKAAVIARSNDSSAH